MVVACDPMQWFQKASNRYARFGLLAIPIFGGLAAAELLIGEWLVALADTLALGALLFAAAKVKRRGTRGRSS